MKKNPVITQEQARQITGGRTPLVPVEYTAAVTALAKCLTIDDAKYWADKADALAAWAKIYRDDKVGRQSKMLKLEAFRRMGQLAQDLRPRKMSVGTYTKDRQGRFTGAPGFSPGPRSLLIEQGLTRNEANAARSLAILNDRAFEKLLQKKVIPTPSTALNLGTTLPSEISEIKRALYILNRAIKKSRPDLASSRLSDSAVICGIVSEIIEWCDEFLQRLPKVK